MEKQARKLFLVAIASLLVFTVWTIAVCVVDVKPIGPKGSMVGFAAINGEFYNLTGSNMSLYTITDWLGFVPICVCVCFGVLGFIQLVKRKSIFKVDKDIITLGLFYIIVIIFYLFFECVAINYRPILINNFLESSYPSSTTLLTLCIMPTAVFQISRRKAPSAWRIILCTAIWTFSAFMVIGRLISGVHWLTDIIGSVFLSGGLVTLYISVCAFISKNQT